MSIFFSKSNHKITLFFTIYINILLFKLTEIIYTKKDEDRCFELSINSLHDSRQKRSRMEGKGGRGFLFVFFSPPLPSPPIPFSAAAWG